MPGDPGLRELGREQAAVTCQWLRRTGLRALYGSPLRRARETAEHIGHATGLVILTLGCPLPAAGRVFTGPDPLRR
jgi:broad specificity phosphatase PhoE